MIRTTILTSTFFLITLTLNAHITERVDSLYEVAKALQKQGKYQESIVYLDTISAQLDSILHEINYKKIDDLRTTYSIANLDIENRARKNRFLNYVLQISVVVVAILLICFILLRLEKRKLQLSKARLRKAVATSQISIQNKSLFLSNMSHEIRTPLNAISGFSDLLINEGLDDATRQQCNEVIQQNSHLLLTLINEVVDLSCMDVNTMPIKYKQCNVVSLCQNVVNTLEGIKQTHASILFNSKYPSLNIETDTIRLQQVLINLLVNATKFTPEGSITLSIDGIENEYIRFSITDTGCGIPKDKQKHIFQRYEKLNEKAHGTGIGLSLCQQIINILGGEIWIDPNYEGGSRFIFTHPLIKQNNI